MADARWGYGGPNQPETGISQVLAGFASRGGQLLGARRWPENPLTLTHVRWVGPDGFIVEAHRRPDFEDGMPPEEREVWVQLALHCPVPATPPSGADGAPWLLVGVEPARASEWLRMVQRARASQASQAARSGGYVADGRYGGMTGIAGSSIAGAPTMVPARRSPYDLGPMGVASGPSRPLRTPRSFPPSAYGPPSGAEGYAGEPEGGAGSWQRDQRDPREQRDQWDGSEVIVLPCIEIELPPMLGDPLSGDGVRDFTRDVATHFSRACRTIPQVRETRGWMRGRVMVLAARMVVAHANRTATRGDMEAAAAILADVLAQRTLPYTRLTFADAGAWAQGTALPE